MALSVEDLKGFPGIPKHKYKLISVSRFVLGCHVQILKAGLLSLYTEESFRLITKGIETSYQTEELKVC